MSYWQGQTVTLQLSALGQQVFDQAFIEVSVEWADEHGLWTFREQVDEATRTVMLIRWAHFETAVMDAVIRQPDQAQVFDFKVGFRHSKF